MSRISKGVNIAVCVGVALLILLPAGSAEGASDKASKLLELARERFGSISKAEEKLFRKVVNGELADCSDRLEENNDPNRAKDWDKKKRAIRAECVTWLCTEPEASALVTHKGIRVKGARIDGELDLAYARISFPLYFEKSAFQGGINLRRAEIQALFLIGTHTGPISADGLKVEGDVILRNGFKAEGQVRLVGATIGGYLDCDGGQFINKGAKALNAGAVKLNGSVYLSEGFKAEGEVNLVIATIGGDLGCSGGKFINKWATALSASGMKVKGNVYLRNGFKAEGEVDLIAATIDGHFQWRDVNSREKAMLNLRSATIGTLWDDANSWPDPGRLFLHGLVYNEIYADAPRDANSRTDWLRRQPDFWPQPYEQLAAVLRKSGQERDARKILIAKNEDRARLAKTWSEKCWYHVLGPMIGYGYRPLNALWGVAAFVALGWVLFGIGYRARLITPQSESAYVKGSVSTAEGRELSDVYPRFNFLVYSVDTFVPLIDLHQAKYWLPNAHRGRELLKIKAGGLLRLYLWIHITMGWALTMLLVAGLTGLVRT